MQAGTVFLKLRFSILCHFEVVDMFNASVIALVHCIAPNCKIVHNFFARFCSKKCLKGPRVTCLVALNKKNGLFWSFWFMSDRGVTQTINSDQYCSELDFLLEDTIVIMPFVVGHKLWLQQDGTTAHKANAALINVKNDLKTKNQLQD